MAGGIPPEPGWAPGLAGAGAAAGGKGGRELSAIAGRAAED